MRDFHHIEIVRGVTHVLAPRNTTMGLRLSEAELPLGGGVDEILAAHVTGGLGDAQAKAAKFIIRAEDRACGVFARLLGGEANLVELSQQLARNLYSLVENDARISDGTLAVLLCKAIDASGASAMFPAVLKLDPSATLRMVMDTEPVTNRARVRYEVDQTTLPSKNERIQKCAFVQVVDPDREYEMLVVDRQRRQETVSRFWVTDFLGAEFAYDAPERTKRLYRILLSARNDAEPELDATQLLAFDRVMKGTVAQASVNIDQLVAALPVPEPIRERVAAALSQSLPDREFDLDATVAGQLLQRRAFRGDNGLRLSVGAEFTEMIHVEDLEPGTNEGRLRRVWFETRTWKES